MPRQASKGVAARRSRVAAKRPRSRTPQAVITGATSGIGLEVSILLLRCGYHVTAIGSRPEAPARLRRIAPRGRLRYVSARLDRHEDVDRLLLNLTGRLPRLRLLAHAAGVFWDDVECLNNPDVFRGQMSVNFEAPVRLTKGLEACLRRDRGTVAFLGSSAAVNPSPTNGMYAASKAALYSVVKALRQNLNRQQVRVLWLAIGRTNTPMQRAILRREGRARDARYLISPVTLARLIVFLCELPKDLEVTDIAARPMRKLPERA